MVRPASARTPRSADTSPRPAGRPKVGGTTPVFGVRDLAAARSHLESNGVRFDGETQVIPEMVKLATFYDPDGNPPMLAESNMPHT